MHLRIRQFILFYRNLFLRMNKKKNQINSMHYIYLVNLKLFVFSFFIHVGASGYDIVADIRSNFNGFDILHYDGFKFNKNKSNGQSISWVCCKRVSEKCKTSANTKDIMGTIMMKWNGIEHTHDPDSK